MMKINLKTTYINACFLLSTLALTACSNNGAWSDAVKPSSTTFMPASTDNVELASRVGVSTLNLPGDTAYVPARNSNRQVNYVSSAPKTNYIQAFINMGLDARETTNGFVVFLPSSGHFDKNKTFVKRDISNKIPQIVAEANKSYLSAHKIQVAGHADSPGSLSHNQSLSERRATEVMNDMIENGLSKQRVSTLGFGERLPLHNQNIHYNRRTDILFHNP